MNKERHWCDFRNIFPFKVISLASTFIFYSFIYIPSRSLFLLFNSSPRFSPTHSVVLLFYLLFLSFPSICFPPCNFKSSNASLNGIIYWYESATNMRNIFFITHFQKKIWRALKNYSLFLTLHGDKGRTRTEGYWMGVKILKRQVPNCF